MVGLSSSHQSFLQNLMARGALSTDDTKKLFNQCVQGGQGSSASEVQDVEDLKHQIYIINKAISIADFTIRPAYSPWEETTYWGFCNTTSDEAARVATKLRPAEVELFFKIVEELREYDGVLPLPDAQNVSSRNMTVSENSRAIQQMHQLQWLRIIRKAGEQTTVVVGARALIELPRVRDWARKFAEGYQGVGEPGGGGGVDVDDMEDDDDVQPQREVKPVRRRGSRRVSFEEDDDDEEEEEEDEVRPVSRSRSRRSQLM